MPQYCVYTYHPQFSSVLEWLDSRRVIYDVHLNRTRFTVTDARVLTEFLLKWGDVCYPVDPAQDLATGFAGSWDRDRKLL